MAVANVMVAKASGSALGRSSPLACMVPVARANFVLTSAKDPRELADRVDVEIHQPGAQRDDGTTTCRLRLALPLDEASTPGPQGVRRLESAQHRLTGRRQES